MIDKQLEPHEVIPHMRECWPHSAVLHLIPCEGDCTHSASQVRDVRLLSSLPVIIPVIKNHANLWDAICALNVPLSCPNGASSAPHASSSAIDLAQLIKHLQHTHFILYMDIADFATLNAVRGAMLNRGAQSVAVVNYDTAEIFAANPELVFSRRVIMKARFRRRNAPVPHRQLEEHVVVSADTPSRVVDGLYIGSDQISAETLLKLRIATVIDVRSPQEAALRPPLGDAIRFPLHDSTSQSITETAHETHAAIMAGMKRGNVLVHCVQGRSRSAAVVLAHLMLSGATLRSAWRALFVAHPVMRPNVRFWSDLIAMEAESGTPSVSVAEVLGAGQGQRVDHALSVQEAERLALALLVSRREVPFALLIAIEAARGPAMLEAWVRDAEKDVIDMTRGAGTITRLPDQEPQSTEPDHEG